METIMTFLRVYTGKSDETENGKKRSFGRWRREMFREIRKKKNAITADAAESLLEKSRRGVLAVNGDDGYPYAIPVNYFYDRNEQKIYFHGARAGHKVDALRASDKVCFTVYGNQKMSRLSPGPGFTVCVTDLSDRTCWQSFC